MPEHNPDNKRAHERFQVAVAVQVQSAPGSAFLLGQRLTCQTRDISLSGMCIYAQAEFPPNTRLTLTLDLGEPAKTFNLLGKVIWSTQDKDSQDCYQTGINLIILPGDARDWQNAVIQMLVG